MLGFVWSKTAITNIVSFFLHLIPSFIACNHFTACGYSTLSSISTWFFKVRTNLLLSILISFLKSSNGVVYTLYIVLSNNLFCTPSSSCFLSYFQRWIKFSKWVQDGNECVLFSYMMTLGSEEDVPIYIAC